MSIQLQRDESIALRIEARGRTRFVSDAALQRKRRSGLESKKEIPERPYQPKLEPEAASDRESDEQRARCEGVKQQTSGAKT